MTPTAPADPPLKELPISRIDARSGIASLRLDEIWQYRELLYFLAWKEIRVRYSQTALGAAWAVIQPFTTMVIFSVFLGRLAKVPSDGIPYPIFTYTALLPWTLFANSIAQTANSLDSNSNLISKVYFPRLILPLAAVVSQVVDFFFAFLVLLAMMAYFRVHPSWASLCVLPLLLLTLMAALGVGLWLATLSVQYRDVRHTIPFLVQAWMFATPIVYPSSLLPGYWRTLSGLNPMAGVVDGFRWALLGSGAAPGLVLAASFFTSAVVLVSGLFLFQIYERSFADKL